MTEKENNTQLPRCDKTPVIKSVCPICENTIEEICYSCTEKLCKKFKL